MLGLGDALLVRPRLKEAKIAQPTFYRFRHSAEQTGHSQPKTHGKPHPRSKMYDKRIAAVCQIEFEPLGRVYRCTSLRPAFVPCKRQRGSLKQEKSADPPFRIAGNPEAFLV